MRSSLTIAAFLFLALSSLATATVAQESEQEEDDDRRYGQFYNGAFVDFSARAALLRASSTSYDGWSYDVGLRQAFPMHLLDTRIAYVEDRFYPRTTAQPGRFTSRSIGVWTALHPLYLALLFSDWFGYLLASLYLELGVAGQYATHSSGEGDFGLRWSVGGGFDVPLTDPDRGWSIWANALYRYTWADYDFDAGGEIDLYHHAGWAGLSLRFNGLLF